MSILRHYQARFEAGQEDEMSLEEYLADRKSVV